MNKIFAVTCVIINDKGQILLLKRSPDKKYFPNKWASVGAAPLTPQDDRKFIALREIKDELGVDGEITKEGKELIFVVDNDQEWHIKTFLGKIKNYNIKLNHEHTEYRWVNPDDLKNFDLLKDNEKMILELLKYEK